MMGSISVSMFSDAACPWAYSVSPSLRVLEWRYGEQLDWRLVLIGLTEALAGLFFTPSAKSMFSFGLLVLVLLFRPQGILGKKAS